MTAKAPSKNTAIDISAMQQALKQNALDGWLFYYFKDNDPIALRILGLQSDHFVSRRWLYYVPANGSPIKLVHRIESDVLDDLPGERRIYVGWRQLEQEIGHLLKGSPKVAMQYSQRNSIPYVSRVDAGMVELVRSTGCEVVSSCDLVQLFEATWTAAQLDSHVEAVEGLKKIVFLAFDEVKRCINSEEPIDEHKLQQFIIKCFRSNGLITNSPPIVAVNEHSGSPHYLPTADNKSPIKEGDLLLLDIWARKTSEPENVYGDITWTGFVGKEVPKKHDEIFQIVRGARDAALNFVKESVKNKKELYGWQVDDVARTYITERGYGDYFVHRTGHSIGTEVHGNGANIDNLETKDERRLIPCTAFSIEPGIYLKEFGIRSEIDVYISENDVIVAGEPIQTEIIPILK